MYPSFSALFQNMYQNFSDKTAFRFFDNERKDIISVTYDKFVKDTYALAERLVTLYPDISAMKVGVITSNTYECIRTCMGIFLAGGTAVLLDGYKERNSLAYDMNHTDVRLLFSDVDVKDIALVGEIDHYSIEHAFDELQVELKEEMDWSRYDIDTDENRERVLIFTSGTMGVSKAVKISFKNIKAGLRYLGVTTRSTSEYVGNYNWTSFLCVPYYHVAGFTMTFHFLEVGGIVTLNSSPRYFYQDLANLNPAITLFAPMQLSALEKEFRAGHHDRYDSLKVVVSGGASANHELMDYFAQFGVLVVDMYGMSETTAAGCMSDFADQNTERKLRSIGHFYPEAVVRIIDDEICFKGDAVTSGYYNDPERTAEVFDEDGWFHSGDIGYVDEDGFVFITGRKKNLIILDSGENVSPEELESKLLDNESIIECIVKEKDHKICAEIYCGDADQDAISAYVKTVNRTMVMYKRITLVEFRDTPFERTATGKIKR